jgi:hypothetical protein
MEKADIKDPVLTKKPPLVVNNVVARMNSPDDLLVILF